MPVVTTETDHAEIIIGNHNLIDCPFRSQIIEINVDAKIILMSKTLKLEQDTENLFYVLTKTVTINKYKGTKSVLQIDYKELVFWIYELCILTTL